MLNSPLHESNEKGTKPSSSVKSDGWIPRPFACDTKAPKHIFRWPRALVDALREHYRVGARNDRIPPLLMSVLIKTTTGTHAVGGVTSNTPCSSSRFLSDVHALPITNQLMMNGGTLPSIRAILDGAQRYMEDIYGDDERERSVTVVLMRFLSELLLGSLLMGLALSTLEQHFFLNLLQQHRSTNHRRGVVPGSCTGTFGMLMTNRGSGGSMPSSPAAQPTGTTHSQVGGYFPKKNGIPSPVLSCANGSNVGPSGWGTGSAMPEAPPSMVPIHSVLTVEYLLRLIAILPMYLHNYATLYGGFHPHTTDQLISRVNALLQYIHVHVPMTPISFYVPIPTFG